MNVNVNEIKVGNRLFSGVNILQTNVDNEIVNKELSNDNGIIENALLTDIKLSTLYLM